MPGPKKHRKLLPLCLAGLAAGLWLVPALAQNSFTEVKDPAQITGLKDPSLGDPESQPVPFMHDAHNAKAGLKNCTVCHHTYKNGKRLPGRASVNQKCSDCHSARPGASDTAPALMTAFHKRCQDCHQAKGKGPTACSQCHKK